MHPRKTKKSQFIKIRNTVMGIICGTTFNTFEQNRSVYIFSLFVRSVCNSLKCCENDFKLKYILFRYSMFRVENGVCWTDNSNTGTCKSDIAVYRGNNLKCNLTLLRINLMASIFVIRVYKSMFTMK